MHFLAAGFEPEELFGAYIAEDRCKTVWLYPGQKALRYLVPFGKVEDVIVYLRDAASTPTSTPISPTRGANLSGELRLLRWLSVNAHMTTRASFSLLTLSIPSRCPRSGGDTPLASIVPAAPIQPQGTADATPSPGSDARRHFSHGRSAGPADATRRRACRGRTDR
jgi:hypothetical protein